ncbi:MAG TPA: sensor histidine kinase, partial [Pseudolabrys sp.]
MRFDAIPRLSRSAWSFFVAQSFSSLTRRIVFLNLAGLIALLSGVLYLSQFRAGLIDARVESLLVQSEIIAGAIAASATVDTDSITIDPDRLLELQPGESYGPSDDTLSGIEFPINPERVAPVLRRLVSPTKTRARIYDRDGVLILDSRNLYGRGDVLRFDLPPPTADKPGIMERGFIAIRRWFGRGDLPLYKELGPENGKGYSEVDEALDGAHASVVRVNDRGEVIVSVAVPVQRFRAVRGALMLSTQGADIDDMVEAERLAIFKVFLVAAAVMVVLSMLLAGTIAGPVRRLAEGAERVRRRIRTRVEIPDFTRRRDEIGHLSGALRDMTSALYTRIEAIESFAADVAHELRNPLTSLRSAVETLPMAKTDANRKRLLDVIEHDVKRLDRLISDISDASRLDAELQRHEVATVELARLLEALVQAANEIHTGDVKVMLAFEGGPHTKFEVYGHDSRLGQVVSNLIDNARSFSPPGGNVRITCRRLRNEIEIVVDDDGPGIRP